MMKNWLFIALWCLLPIVLPAQSKSGLIDNKTEITWLGIDFTQLQFIGPASHLGEIGPITSDALREKYFPAWNQLILEEPHKYDVARSVSRPHVLYATDLTAERNSKTGDKEFFTSSMDNYQSLDEAKIAKLIKEYQFGDRSGVGMVWFVESMNKYREEATIWVTFVDMENGHLIYAGKYLAKAGGFGFRNYWAKPFATVFKTLRNDFRKLIKK